MKHYNSFINAFDQLSYKPFLFVNNSDRYKSLTPAVFGLTVILVVISLSIYFLNGTLSRKTPLVFYNELDNYHPTTDFKNNTFSFYLGNGQTNIYDSSIFHFNALSMEYGKKLDKNGTLVEDFKFIEMPIERCKQDDFDQYNISLNINSFCFVKNHNLTFSGYYGDIVKGYTYLNLFVNRCENITTYENINGVNTTVVKNKKFPNETVCKSSEQINKTLQNVFFGFGAPIGNLNHNDFDEPLTYSYKYYVLPMSSTIFKRYFLKLRNVIYETDIGLVFEERRNHTGYISPEQEVSVDLKVGAFLNPSAFGQLTFQTSVTSFYYKRSYSKLQFVIANAGGAWNALSTIGMIIMYFLSKNEYFLFLTNKCFEIEENEEKLNDSKVQFKEKQKLVTNFNNQINTIKTNKQIERPNTLNLNLFYKSFPFKICGKSDKFNILETAKEMISQKLNYLTILNNMIRLENLIQISLNNEQKDCLEKFPKMKIFCKTSQKENQTTHTILSHLNKNSLTQNNYLVSNS